MIEESVVRLRVIGLQKQRAQPAVAAMPKYGIAIGDSAGSSMLPDAAIWVIMGIWKLLPAQNSRQLNSEHVHMEIQGIVQNGVVVFERPVALPEGAVVVVTFREEPVIHYAKNPRAVVLPIFDSDQPGTLDLTNDRIAEILDQEDASS